MTASFSRLLLLAGALSVLSCLPAQAQAPAQSVKMVKPGLFMITGGGGNTAVRVTSDGLIVVDSKNDGQAIYDALMGRIRTISAQPIRWLIDTHHHGDHTGNNTRFKAAGARIIAQANLPNELDHFTAPQSNPTATTPPAKPDETFASTRTLTLGGKSVRLLHFTPAHTRADAIVYFPDLKVVAMGDEVVATAPFFDYPGGLSMTGWMSSLDQILKLDWDLAIPGHGDDPLTRAEVTAFRGKLKTILDRAKEQVRAGAPKDQLIAKLKTDDLWTLAPNYWTQARVDGLWKEAGGK